MNSKAILILSFFCLLYACNQHEEKTTQTNIQHDQRLPSKQERFLLDEVSHYPDSLLLKENLIQYYRDNENDSMAIVMTNAFLSKDSINSRLWHIKAILMLENEDTLKAISSFEKAINIVPVSSDLIRLGIIYAYQKNNKAITLSNNLIELFNDEFKKEALYIKGLYLSNTQHKAEAIDCFNQCISISFTFMEAYREKALALLELKKYNEAIIVLTKATTIKNKYDEGYYYLGKCYEKIKDTTLAADSYRRALLFNPENEEAAEALSVMVRGYGSCRHEPQHNK